MTIFRSETWLGLFLAVMGVMLLTWTVSTFRIGAFDLGGWHVSRRTNPIFFWIMIGWVAFVMPLSFALFAIFAFGIDVRFWL